MYEHPGGSYAQYTLFVLLLIYISNQWCRYLLNYLYAVSYNDDDDNAGKISLAYDTGISASEYGLLVGYGFAFFYVVCGLFMGRAADFYNRKNIIFIGVLIWSLAIVLMAVSTSFGGLLASRVILGIGESFSAPSSYSLIADYFTADGRGQANGIYAFGVYVGGGLSSLSIVMAQSIGWRETCWIIAFISLGLAFVLIVSVREPPRTVVTATSNLASSAYDDMTMIESLKEILSNRLVVMLMVAGSVRFMAGYAIGGYFAVFFEAEYPSFTTQYSYINASVVAIGGATSSYLGGKISDEWSKSGSKNARLYVPIIGSLLAVPFIMIVLLSSSFYVSIIALFFEYLVAECWFGPVISVLQNSLHPRLRGIGIASFTFLATMCGSLMVVIIGWLYDFFNDDINMLKIILLLAISSTYILAAFFFWLATFFNTSENEVSKGETAPLIAKQEEKSSEQNGKKLENV